MPTTGPRHRLIGQQVGEDLKKNGRSYNLSKVVEAHIANTCNSAETALGVTIDFWPDTRAVSPLHGSGARSDFLPNIDEQGFRTTLSRACAHVHLDLQRTTR